MICKGAECLTLQHQDMFCCSTAVVISKNISHSQQVWTVFGKTVSLQTATCDTIATFVRHVDYVWKSSMEIVVI